MDTEPMPCPTCGEPLEQRDLLAGGYTYCCKQNHWFLLSAALGWLVIPEPGATGVAE